MKLRTFLALPLAAFGIAAALAAAAPHPVAIEGMQFKPGSVNVARGDTLTWTNKDPVPHTATARGAFDSGNIAPGQSFSRKMEQPGEFDYICSYHPGMKGKVVVK
ncbi:cupredoxin domain-containing protein [Ramlibacter sp. PS4R-6]|uniref:cupredoxin domain-containing protein n=1 Tax=Ramlibacter sp. PS4R-6 TaxID=3133438 RepID=UPI0030A2ACE2